MLTTKSYYRYFYVLSVFRFLDYISNRFVFIGLSLFLRVVEALGASAAIVSGFSMIGSHFPDNLSTVFVSIKEFRPLARTIVIRDRTSQSHCDRTNKNRQPIEN